MSISDLYSSGKHKSDIGHFASIVKLASTDEVITDSEQKLLDHLGKRLDLTQEEVKNIVKNPDKFPINPPVSYDERIERLFNLTKMIFADDEVIGEEAAVLRKVAAGLGFPLDNIEKVTDEAIHLVMNDNDLEDFSKAIKSVNKI